MQLLSQECEHVSYKLCVHGKKINPSTDVEMGQINLFVYETPPTASERAQRLADEKSRINDIHNKICKSEIVSTQQVVHIMTDISCRIRDLRRQKVSKLMLKNKRMTNIYKEIA